MNKTIVITEPTTRKKIQGMIGGEITLGLIGGSIFDHGEEIFGTEPVITLAPRSIPTPFDRTDGIMPGEIYIYSINGKFVAVTNRHGPNHKILPHEIPCRTMIYTLRTIGVEFITAFSASGSVNQLIPVGSLALPNQFIDRTCNRRDTFFGSGLGGHISGSDPFCNYGIIEISKALQSTGETVISPYNSINQRDLTIVVIQGPRFSTRAESKMFATIGADIVCMTPYPEGILAPEAGMCYVVVMIVTDIDAGDHADRAVNVGQVLAVLKGKNQNMACYIDAITRADLPGCDCRCHQLVTGALQSKTNLTSEQQTMFDLFTEISRKGVKK